MSHLGCFPGLLRSDDVRGRVRVHHGEVSFREPDEHQQATHLHSHDHRHRHRARQVRLQQRGRNHPQRNIERNWFKLVETDDNNWFKLVKLDTRNL